MFNFGIPSSFSVYILGFFFTGPGADLVFCCLGGGPLICLETRGLDPLLFLSLWFFDCELFLPPLLTVFAELILELTVLVGAILRIKVT